jgi:hypothetical protein
MVQLKLVGSYHWHCDTRRASTLFDWSPFQPHPPALVRWDVQSLRDHSMAPGVRRRF